MNTTEIRPSDESVPEVVRGARRVVQKAFVSTGVNQASELHKDAVEKAVDTALWMVVEALEHAYHPQNPTNAHPADFVTKRFELDGHEGLSC